MNSFENMIDKLKEENLSLKYEVEELNSEVRRLRYDIRSLREYERNFIGKRLHEFIDAIKALELDLGVKSDLKKMEGRTFRGMYLQGLSDAYNSVWRQIEGNFEDIL
jgi:predicted RNase H-like nuclease (RuvC/YqgF family)